MAKGCWIETKRCKISIILVAKASLKQYLSVEVKGKDDDTYAFSSGLEKEVLDGLSNDPGLLRCGLYAEVVEAVKCALRWTEYFVEI